MERIELMEFRIPLNLLMASRNMKKRKARTALTVLGIAVGVTAIVSLTSVSEGMRIQMTEWIKSSMGADLIVTSSGSSEMLPEGKMPEDYVKRISELDDVDSISTQLYGMGVVEGEGCLIQGIESDTEIKHITITGGYMLKENSVDDVVIGHRLGSRLNVHVGDYLTLSSPIREWKFRVAGTFQTTSLMMDESCIVSLKDMQSLFGDEGKVSSVLVTLHEPADTGIVKAKIEELLSGVRVVEQSQVLETVQQGTKIIETFLVVVASISMIVAGIGIMNTMFISVVERRRDIGIMKAIGMSRGQILITFLSEAMMIGIIGGLMGCVSGIVVSKISEVLSVSLFDMPMAVKFSPKTMVFGLLFSLMLATLSGAYPCWRASSYRPVECLKYE